MRAIWILFLVLLAVPLAHAATFSCTIRASTSCNAGETAFIRLNSSETGAAPNNSHAQLANWSGTQYPHTVCCSTDAFRTLANSCSATSTTVLKLFNETDSHVQAGSQSGYSWNACLNVTAGNISCEYPTGACSAGYSQVLSIASSEAADNNLTNAHVGSFALYDRKVCCQIGGQNPPSVAFANVTPNPTATTRDDLLCNNGTVSDPDGDDVTLHYNWYRNGTSITVLNLPMDYDSSLGVTHDISGHNNHGTVNGATFLPTGGWVGGAFSFDGTNDYISLGNSSRFNTSSGSNVTFMAWVNHTGGGFPTIMGKRDAGSDQNFRFGFNGNTIVFYVTDSNRWESADTYAPNTLQHITVVHTFGSGSLIKVYVDGAEISGSWVGGAGNNAGTSIHNVSIGRPGDTNNFYFQGKIDDVMLFNRRLSATEISALYNQYNYNVSGTELRRNDFWNCSITPIDSTGLNGTTKLSNQTNISGSPPLAVTLQYPLNNNNSVFERYVNFNWSDADERDGDSLNYTLNLTVQPGACSVQTTQSNIGVSNYTFGELCTDQYYNWTVRVCDIDGCASSSQFNFTIASLLSITLLNNNTNFGTLSLGQSIDTELGAVAPYRIENNGNVVANITLNASNSPFSTAALGSTAFQFKVRENETGAFNSSGSQTSYTPVDAALKNVIKQLQYNDTLDAAYVDINITVPSAETPGSKTTNVTFRAQVSE